MIARIIIVHTLDYCNSLLVGYAAARLVVQIKQGDHITPVIYQLQIGFQ